MRALGVMLAVTLLSVSIGCESEHGGGDHALDGTNWRLTGWSASSPDPSRFVITAAFDDSIISGASAVNSYELLIFAEE